MTNLYLARDTELKLTYAQLLMTAKKTVKNDMPSVGIRTNKGYNRRIIK